jgi:hypothetical protein
MSKPENERLSDVSIGLVHDNTFLLLQPICRFHSSWPLAYFCLRKLHGQRICPHFFLCGGAKSSDERLQHGRQGAVGDDRSSLLLKVDGQLRPQLAAQHTNIGVLVKVKLGDKVGWVVLEHDHYLINLSSGTKSAALLTPR